MFTHKHYVPILKTKAGERAAIRTLKAASKPHVTPLFELHPHASTNEVDHAKDVAKKLAADWGTGNRCFVDSMYISSAAAFLAFFDEARGLGLQVIPVVHTTSGLPLLQAAQQIHGADNRGVMIRCEASGIAGVGAALPSLTSFLAIPRNQVDLLLDYERRAMALPTDVPQIPNIADWRTFTAASGVFPPSLAPLPLYAWQPTVRHCWHTWLAALAGPLARKPTFSDYGTRSPGKPPAGGEPSVNVRYATAADWQVQLGGKVKDGRSTDIYPICANLITQHWYSGPAFSSGDSTFHDVASHTSPGPGNSTSWVQWSLNHHLEFVSNQIQTHPGV